METPLTAVLYAMERRGIALDQPFLEGARRELSGPSWWTWRVNPRDGGQDFNVQSPQQLAKVLFEDLGLKPLKE